MAGAASLAKLAGLWMSDVGTSSPNRPFSYSRFLNGCSEEPIDTGARTNWGSLSHPEHRVRRNIRRCQPSLEMIPSMIEWERLLQWIQGGTPVVTTAGSPSVTTTVYPLSNTALERTITHIDEYTSLDCLRVAVDRATISGRQQEEITLALECVGTNWATPSAFTPTALRSTAPSLLFGDLTISIAGTNTYKAMSAEVRIDKAIDRERFFNTNIMPAIIAKDRIVTVRLEIPWGLHYELWQAGIADSDDGIDPGGVALVLTWSFTWGGRTFSLAATMPAVRAATNPLEYRVPEETMLTWEGQAYAPNYTGVVTPPPLLDPEILFTLVRPT